MRGCLGNHSKPQTRGCGCCLLCDSQSGHGYTVATAPLPPDELPLNITNKIPAVLQCRLNC
jgi:hypothetical protein